MTEYRHPPKPTNPKMSLLMAKEYYDSAIRTLFDLFDTYSRERNDANRRRLKVDIEEQVLAVASEYLNVQRISSAADSSQ